VIPYARIVTPNRHEAGALVGRRVETAGEMADAAGELVAAGARAVVVTGSEAAGDVLHHDGAGQARQPAVSGQPSWLQPLRAVRAAEHREIVQVLCTDAWAAAVCVGAITAGPTSAVPLTAKSSANEARRRRTGDAGRVARSTGMRTPS
jgi:sugar/nucleoside kinase (ribokinase family)